MSVGLFKQLLSGSIRPGSGSQSLGRRGDQVLQELGGNIRRKHQEETLQLHPNTTNVPGINSEGLLLRFQFIAAVIELDSGRSEVRWYYSKQEAFSPQRSFKTKVSQLIPQAHLKAGVSNCLASGPPPCSANQKVELT